MSSCGLPLPPPVLCHVDLAGLLFVSLLVSFRFGVFFREPPTRPLLGGQGSSVSLVHCVCCRKAIHLDLEEPRQNFLKVVREGEQSLAGTLKGIGGL